MNSAITEDQPVKPLRTYRMQIKPEAVNVHEFDPSSYAASVRLAVTALAEDGMAIVEPVVWRDGDAFHLVSGLVVALAAAERKDPTLSVRVVDDPRATREWYLQRVLMANMRDMLPDTAALAEADARAKRIVDGIKANPNVHMPMPDGEGVAVALHFTDTEYAEFMEHASFVRTCTERVSLAGTVLVAMSMAAEALA